MIRFAVAAVFLASFSTATLADLIIEARETGGDVVFTASGSLDLTGWVKASSGSTTSTGAISPSNADIDFPLSGTQDEYYLLEGLTPNNFGTGSQTFASSGTGDNFRFRMSPVFPIISVDAGYQFGDQISATMTFDNATIDSLGIDPGDTVWSWLAVEPASFDVSPIVAPTSSITLRAIAIPEPSAFGCLGLIGLVAAGRGWWTRRR